MVNKSLSQKLRDADNENRRLIEYLSEVKYIVTKDLDLESDKLDKILKIIIKWQSEG